VPLALAEPRRRRVVPGEEPGERRQRGRVGAVVDVGRDEADAGRRPDGVENVGRDVPGRVDGLGDEPFERGGARGPEGQVAGRADGVPPLLGRSVHACAPVEGVAMVPGVRARQGARAAVCPVIKHARGRGVSPRNHASPGGSSSLGVQHVNI
jgi:hypothetical protein